MPYKEIAKQREAQRASFKRRLLSNREEILKKKRDYNKLHPEKSRAWSRNYRLKHPEKCREITNRIRDRIRLEVLTYYSKGEPKCACCGETILEFLSIDHINGRKNAGHPRHFGGKKLYYWLKKNNFPEGYRVLCYNCNCSLGFNGYCPHHKGEAMMTENYVESMMPSYLKTSIDEVTEP